MSFKNYFESHILQEDTPVSGEYDTWYPSLRTGVSTRSQTNDVYLFKDIANALNITVPTAVDRVSLSLFNKLFPNNQPNPANTEEEYRDAVFNALTEIVNEINRQSNTDIKNSKSQKAYTSRIISSLGQTVKTFDGAAPRVVRAAINRVNQQVLQAEPATAPALPLTELDKLKNKLHRVGSGIGINITKQNARDIYGIPDVENIAEIDFVRLIKKVKETAFGMVGKFRDRKIVEYMQGTLGRFAALVSIPFTNTRDQLQNDASALRADVALPRVKLSYETALANKVVSPRGRLLIQRLVDNFNVVPNDVYITAEYNIERVMPSLRIVVSIRTTLNVDIIYMEIFSVNKRVYDTALVSDKRYRTVNELNQILNTDGYRLPNTVRDFYLQ